MSDESEGVVMPNVNQVRIEDIKMNVGEGWHHLVLDLNDILNNIDPHYELLQVKEKFGTLRYYVHSESVLADKVFGDIIHAFERLSEITCEVCGKFGSLRNRGWFRTLCDECNDK